MATDMTPLRLLVFLEATTVTGPAKNLLRFATLAREQHSIETTIAVFRRSTDSGVFQEAAQRAGVALKFIDEKGRFDSSVLAAMSALVLRLQPDIIQTHAVKGHFLAWRAGLPRLAPWVAFHHGYTWTDWKVRLYNQLDRWSLREARHVVTVSQPFAAELEGKGVDRAKITVVHNAIDPHWGRREANPEALRARLKIPSGSKVLLLVGRFSREKDHLGLLDAVAELTRTMDVHLLLVGDGPERPHVVAKAAALGITSRITFTNQVASAEPYYSVADIAVLNSRTEGSPNALLEAMAARVPVVATSVGGIPEIVRDRESALLVPAGNPRLLTEALQELLWNPSLGQALADTAYTLAVERHSPGGRVKRLAELYRTIVASPR